MLEHSRLFSYLCLYELIEASYDLQFHHLDDIDEQTEGQRVGTADYGNLPDYEYIFFVIENDFFFYRRSREFVSSRQTKHLGGVPQGP